MKVNRDLNSILFIRWNVTLNHDSSLIGRQSSRQKRNFVAFGSLTLFQKSLPCLLRPRVSTASSHDKQNARFLRLIGDYFIKNSPRHLCGFSQDSNKKHLVEQEVSRVRFFSGPVHCRGPVCTGPVCRGGPACKTRPADLLTDWAAGEPTDC